MNEFLKGFIKGCKETPKAYFAPVVVLLHSGKRFFGEVDRIIKHQVH